MTENGHLAHDCRIRNGAGGRISDEWCLVSYYKRLLALPGDLNKGTPLPEELRLPVTGADEEGLAVYYAPFEMVNPGAKVVIVGITPSRDAMYAAINEARAALRAGATGAEVLKKASIAGSFGPGPMRDNLVEWLDGLRLHKVLGLDTGAAQLFRDEHRHLVDMTSAISFPTFYNGGNPRKREGGNYSGWSPDLVKSPLAKAFIDQVLRRQLEASPDALIIPLGTAAATAVERVQSERIPPERCLTNFPHPSNGGGRPRAISEYNKHKQAMTAAVAAWFA